MSDPGRLIGPAYTEVAGEPATRNQHERLEGRYRWAAQQVAGKTVVDVACGTGQGLGLLQASARFVVGADYSPENLAGAKATYAGRIPLLRLDAHRLPLKRASADVVLMMETLYFLPRPHEFVAEAARVLRPGGRLLVSVINKDSPDFQHNPLYPVVFGVPELAALLSAGGLEVECFGAFPLGAPSARQRIIRSLKTVATRYHLMPGSMQAKVWLKRLVFGELKPLPRQVEPGAFAAPVRLPADRRDEAHQVLLAAAAR